MPHISTLDKPTAVTAIPSGGDPLHIRERYLRRRSQRRRFGDRGITALWLGIGAVVSWLFVVGFTTLGH
jgi:hypothetical protein